MKKYLKNFKHANYNEGTMESGDHFKNGASPKSLTSRRNFLRKIYFTILATCIIPFYSCDLSNVEYIKDSTWSEDETVEIGGALDGYKYFIKTEWKEYETKQKREIVEFKGYYYKSDLVVTIQFTLLKGMFAVDDDGNDFQINYQGVSFVSNKGEERKEKISGLMKTIYKNKELFSEFETKYYDMNGQKSKWQKDEKINK